MARAQWVAWVLGVAVALSATPDTSLAASKHLLKARKAYDKLKYEQVLKHLKRALKVDNSPAEEIEIYEFLGRMYVMYNKVALAKDAFVQILKRDPTFELPDTESPKILATLEEARAGTSRAVVSGTESSTTSGESKRPATAGQTEIITATTPGNTMSTDPMLSTTVESQSPFYEKWWFWTAVGVAVVGAATGAVLATTIKPGPPNGDFGPYDLP